jgi:hypothetical protein
MVQRASLPLADVVRYLASHGPSIHRDGCVAGRLLPTPNRDSVRPIYVETHMFIMTQM